MKNDETGEIATATTNTEGNFTIPFLRPGMYTLTVELSGFQKHTRSGMTLAVNETATHQRRARRRRGDRRGHGFG